MATDGEYSVSVRYGGTPATTVIVPSSPQPSEFERFEDLANKLLTVPKSELDEKLKKPSD
jgi:hypothetical protein